MKNILIHCEGSRGDVQPFVTLGYTLVKNGHRVIFCNSEYTHLVEKLKVDNNFIPVSTTPIPPDVIKEMWSNIHSQQDLWNSLGKWYGASIKYQGESVFEAAVKYKADCILSNHRAFCWFFTNVLKIHSFHFHFQPQYPTSSFPHHSNEGFKDKTLKLYFKRETTTAAATSITTKELTEQEGIKNRNTYISIDKMCFDNFKDELLKWKKNHLNSNEIFEEIPWKEFSENTKNLLNNKNVGPTYTINVFSTTLMPPPKDYPSNVYTVGCLRYNEKDEPIKNYVSENKDLIEFLQNSPKPPVYIGWGSMLGDATMMTTLAIKSLMYYDENCYAVLLEGSAGLSLEKLNKEEKDYKNIYSWVTTHCIFIKSTPHPWLLPQISFGIIHGGMGTTHAFLSHGKPIIVTPVLADQFFSGMVVEELGAGFRTLHSLSSGKITHEILGELMKRIDKEEEGFFKRCEKIKIQIEKEGDGRIKIMKLIENL